MKDKVPLVYKIIGERIYTNSIEGKIAVSKTRRVLSYIYRMPRDKLSSIIRELLWFGVLERVNQDYFIVKQSSY